MGDANSPQGRFLGLPYDFRRPTVSKLKERFWNAKDDRIFTPMVFGWGYAINLYQIARVLRLV